MSDGTESERSAVNLDRGAGGSAAAPTPGADGEALESLFLRTALDSCPDVIVIIDPEAMRFLYVNDAACRFLDCSREHLLSVPSTEIMPQSAEATRRDYQAVIDAAGEPVVTEPVYMRSVDQRRKGWWQFHRRATRLGERWVIISTGREVSRQVLAEQASKRAMKMYEAISAANEAILRVDDARQLYQRVCDAAVHSGPFVSAVIARADDANNIEVTALAGRGASRLSEVVSNADLTRREAEGLIGFSMRKREPTVSNDLLADERFAYWHEAARNDNIRAAAAFPLLHDSRAEAAMLLCSEVRNAFDDELLKLLDRMTENIGFALDNFDREADRRRSAEHAEYLATHDALTGLPNRTLFKQTLDLSIRAAQRYQRPFALMFVDLDRFKVINDTLGHSAGDALLKEITRRLKDALRESDVIARLGGDEFIVLAHQIGSEDEAAIVARKILSAVVEPVVIAGQDCRVTTSIGIALFPEHGQNEEALMQNADLAMYRAKEEGKNTFQFYSPEISDRSNQRLALEVGLRTALASEQLTLSYQSKSELASGRVTGVEALLRWHHPEYGNIPPNQFIPIAEETGLIIPIGRWVLETACRQNMAWQAEGFDPVTMAVNLSPRQFQDEYLIEDVAGALERSGMPGEQLELELTESMVVQDPVHAVETLRALKEMGVRIAMDDFGVGYSSLAQLKGFPIDTLKVDRSFIRNLPKSDQDRAITEAIVSMAKTLSLSVVAEGVESADQEHYLRSIACDQSQGYFYTRPLPAAAFTDYLRRRNGHSNANV